MSKFLTVNEDIGGEFRRVAVNLDAVCEIRDEANGTVTFAFALENETTAVLDDDLISTLASHGIVFETPKAMAEAA